MCGVNYCLKDIRQAGRVEWAREDEDIDDFFHISPDKRATVLVGTH
jgi:hypothetical protein